MNLEMDRQGLVTRAAAFAAGAHDGQLRKGSSLPYILHPMEAAAIAATMTDDPEVLAAALLHDCIEDCGVTALEIKERFGPRVARLVMFMTEDKEPGSPANSWQRRKLRTINRLRAASREELILTMADKLSNLRAIERDLREHGSAVWKKFNQTNPTMQRWYYASIAEGLKPLENFEAYQEYLSRLERVFGTQS